MAAIKRPKEKKMNIYTKMIMATLNCNADVAAKVQAKMAFHGVDFSKCSTGTFKKMAKQCFNMI